MNDWELSFGTFPGLLFGIRTYQEQYRDESRIIRRIL